MQGLFIVGKGKSATQTYVPIYQGRLSILTLHASFNHFEFIMPFPNLIEIRMTSPLNTLEMEVLQK